MGTAFEGPTVDNGEVDVEFSLGNVDLGPVGSAADELPETLKLTSTVAGTYTGGTYSFGISGVNFTGTFASNTYSELTADSATIDAESAPYSVTATSLDGYPKFTVTLPINGATAAYSAAQVSIANAGTGASAVEKDWTLAQDTDLVADGYIPVPRGPGEDEGVGAEIMVSVPFATAGTYALSMISLEEAGVDFKAGDILIFDGDNLGGASTNNLTLTVTEIGASGEITAYTVSGQRAVHKPYKVGDTFKILGTALGGNTTANDLTITVASVTSLGLVSTVTVAGTRQAQTLTASAMATALATQINDSALGDTFEASVTLGVVTLQPLATSATSGTLVYAGTHPWAGYTARPFMSSPVVMGGSGVAIAVGASEAGARRASDIGLYPKSVDRAFSPTSGGVFVGLDKLKAGGAVSSYGLRGVTVAVLGSDAYCSAMGLSSSDMVSYAGETGESLSLIKRYEKLHTAFEDLDLASFDYIVPVSAALNSKNIADGYEATYTADTYPTPNLDSDALGYLYAVNNGDYTYTYFWSDDGLSAKIASEGVAADCPADVIFGEVNFAHLLAKYCYENSSDYKFVHGLIGTTIPEGLNPRAIKAYYGTAPTYAYDQDTNAYYVTEDGTGLLGHKFVGGKIDFNGGLKHGGMFLTKDGTLDYSGNNLTLDENSKKVDLGKYISVVSIFGRTLNEINPRRPSYVLNAATMVAGLLPNISVANSLINERVPNLTVDYRIETKVVDAACGLGLVVAKSEPNNGAALIADSPTFASPTSDYTRLTTVRIISKICDELRAAARPYIGKGLSAPTRASLEAALGEVIKANIAGEPVQTITNGSFTIVQSAADRVLGKMRVNLRLTPVFELRQITFSVNLSAQ